MVTRTLAGSALTLMLAFTGSAQPPTPQPPPGSPGAAAAPNAFRAKQVLGSKVLIQNNTAVGTVDDIVISDAGEVEYLVVNNDGKYTTVPWSAAAFNYEQRVATVNIAPAQYNVIPTYTATTYPQFFAPAYRSEVYKFYGLTPGQQRRMERREIRRP